MNDELLVDGMRGLLTKQETLALTAILETEAGASIAAESVPDDNFLLKLREYFNSNTEDVGMNDDQPRQTMMETEAVPRRTMIESDEDIRQVQAELRKIAQGKSTSRETPIEQPYAPSARMPVIALVACDDGKDTGELYRIRGSQFLIGRTEGDLQIAHDEMISSRHVAITRQIFNGEHRAAITDLQSRNGLFVRASKAPLASKAEFFVGSGHYRLEIVQNINPETAAFDGHVDQSPRSTQPLEEHPLPGSVILSEMIHGKAATKIMLDESEYLIGRNKGCEIRRSSDKYTAGVHARLKRSENGTWVLENQKTLNGVWVRLPQIVVEHRKSCEFRIGEQRFRLKLGHSKRD